MTGFNGHSQSDSHPRAFPLLDFVWYLLWAGRGKESSKQGSVTDSIAWRWCVGCVGCVGQTGDRTASVLTLAACTWLSSAIQLNVSSRQVGGGGRFLLGLSKVLAQSEGH